MKPNKSFPLLARLHWTPALFFAAAFAARADIVVPGADGSDGAFNPTVNTNIDLNTAAIGVWNATNTSAGNGVYDQEKWAVVFRYSSVNIPAGVTVRFINRPDGNPPVVWLVNGNVRIAGTVRLDGEAQQNGVRQSNPGPGGFRGGIAQLAGQPSGSAGFGIGGGSVGLCGPCGGPNNTYFSAGASYSTVPDARSWGPYGSSGLIPLLGGSGGGADIAYQREDSGGGAGGGAVLIASTAQIEIAGLISANGGDGGFFSGSGSGGAVRLAADKIIGGGSVQVRGGGHTAGPANIGEVGSAGRIRIEARQPGSGLLISPVGSFATATSPVQLWPADTAPRVRIAFVGSAAAPQYPNGGVPGELAVGSSTGTSTVTVEAFNLTATAKVRLRVTPYSGGASEFLCTRTSGDDTNSIWQAQVPMSPGNASLQVRATTQ